MTGPGVLSLLGEVFLTWRRYLQGEYGRHGVTLKQNYLLRQLESKEFLYPADIARLLFCDRPTASVVIANLVKSGWVTVRPDPVDGRQRRVSLAGPGRGKLADLGRWTDRPETRFDPVACFSETELAEFLRLTRKLAAHLGGLPGGLQGEQAGSPEGIGADEDEHGDAQHRGQKPVRSVSEQ